MNVSSQSVMCDQIAAQILADKRALNATSADGKIGGLSGTVDDELLKKAKKNVNNFVKSMKSPAILTFS